MNIKKLYRNISDKLILDFEDSSLINNNSIKGDYRESYLKEFLLKGRLPKRFDIGKGEIISSFSGNSSQSDLIIYDSFEGISFQGKDDLKVFPIESVCGIIEVKSCLSKEKLIEGLENIKSVKKLARQKTSIVEKRGAFSLVSSKPVPFGIIFAYRLGNNSLSSLRQNLQEWEAENKKEYFSNLIVILNEGIIRHKRELKNSVSFDNDIIVMNYKKDSLFYFYAELLDFCSRTKAGMFNLSEYFEPSSLIDDDLIVRNHNKFIIETKSNPAKRIALKMKSSFIRQVYHWCKIEKSIGAFLTNLNNKVVENKVYFYNPDKLPINNKIYIECFLRKANNKTLNPGHCIQINKETYYIPYVYITKDVLEFDSQMNIEELFVSVDK